ETINSAASRAAIMERVLGFFGVGMVPARADFDGNGDVNGRDFLVWQRGYGKANPTLSDGDANGDGAVDGGDLLLWQEQYATPLPAASLAAPLSTQVPPVSNEELINAAISLGTLKAMVTTIDEAAVVELAEPSLPETTWLPVLPQAKCLAADE